MNIYANSNINENNDFLSRTIIPDNYNILKCVHIPFNSRQFKWYLFQKKNKNKGKNKIIYVNNFKLNNQNDINEDDILYNDFNDISYSDFIFIPERNKKDFINFNLPLSDSYEKEKMINDLESAFKTLEKKYKKKENDFNVLNINFSKLLWENKNSNYYKEKLMNNMEQLKTENNYLNKRLKEYSNQNNFIGVSFIAENENDEHFLDDKCFEDILNELDNRTNINNNHNNLIYKSQKNIYKIINNNPYLNNNQIEKNDKYFYGSASKFYPSSYRNITKKSEIYNNNKIISKNFFLK